MEKFIDRLLERRWLVLAVFILLAALGMYAWKHLAIDAYPDIADVSVGVATQVPGLAVAEIEQQITVPLERELNGIPGLKVMRSKNFFGISKITLVFEDGVDDYWARQRVMERIADIELPFGAQPGLDPLTSPTGEIFRYVVTGDRSLRELTDLNHWVIIPRLKQIYGIADVSNFGGITTQYQIEIDPDRLTAYGLSLSEVTDAIEDNNANAGGSTLMRGDLSYVIRGVGLVQDLDDLGNIVVRSDGGAPVYLRDVGTLKYGNLERKGIMGYLDDETDYEDGVQGMVQLLRYENPSQVLREVKRAVQDLNENILPEGVRLKVFYDRTDLVDATLHTIVHTLSFGILLVLAILMIFLGSPRSALLATVTIPLSLLIAFILMWLTDIPANLLSLGAIDFGIIVDGTIVMMETILKKREDDPSALLDRRTIAQRAAEVAKPIFFATLIIITAYLPLFAFDRVERKLFTPMAFTLSFALLGALAAALLLIPGLAYSVYRKPQKVYRNKWMEALTVKYKAATAAIIGAPRKLIAPIAAVLAAVIGLSVYVGKDFMPELDEGSIWIQVQLPAGMSLEKSSEMATELRHRLKEFDEVTYVMTQTGRDDEGVCPFSFSHIEVMVGLKPYKEWERGRRKSDLINDMAAMLETMPGYGAGFSQPIIDMVMDQIAGSHSDLAVKIYGEDLDEARRIAEEIAQVVSGIEGAGDVRLAEEPFLPQLQIVVDRDRIAQYGLNVADVAELIEVALGGKAVSQVFVGSRVYDVTCRYTEESRDTPEKIGALMLTSASGAKIPLAAVADVRTTIGASMISREMNRRVTTVQVNLRDRDLSSFVAEADRAIRHNVFYDHRDFSYAWGGQLENQDRAFSRLALVVPVTLAVMFLLLFFSFGNFRQAGLLIALLPLMIFGGMLALVVRGMTFNISSAVGFIALFGLAIQNGVIMLSHINILRKRGYELRQAVIEGASHRLRPMLMTATVAIFGLLPASLATGIGSDVQRPLATVIVYGLLFATLVTLFVLPALYYLMERRRLRLSDNKNNTHSGAMLRTLLLLPAILGTAGILHAQPVKIGYGAYLEAVAAGNLEYAAEKLNIDISQAELTAARVFSDVTLSASYSNNSDWSMAMGQGAEFELSKNITFGVRRARMDLAANQKALTEALLDDYLRRLRAQATVVYLEAMRQQELYRVQLDSYDNIRRLAESDSLRFEAGEITEIAARQSRLEADIRHNEMAEAEADLYQALAALGVQMGRSSRDTLFGPDAVLQPLVRDFILDSLLAAAYGGRADLMAAMRNEEVAAAALNLTRKERGPDVELSLGANINSEVLNEIAPAPAFTGISAGLAIPLKFSSINRGAVDAARGRQAQARMQTRQVELQIETEVLQAYRRYTLLSQQVVSNGDRLLSDARSVMDGMLYSYSQGEVSLLEVLDAQRTYNDVRARYIDVVYGQALALVELELAAGIWDIVIL